MISAIPTALSMASPRTDSVIVSCGIMSRIFARSSCKFRTCRRSSSSASRTRRSLSNFRLSNSRAWGLTGPLWPPRSKRRTSSFRPGHSDRKRKVSRVNGAFDSEKDLANVTFVVNGRLIRLRDIANRSPWLRRSAATDVPCQRGACDWPCYRYAGRRRHTGARPEHRKAMKEIKADLPLGVEAFLVADQPNREARHRRFHDFALAGHRNRHGGELPLARRSSRARSSRFLFPLTLADGLPDHGHLSGSICSVFRSAP